MGITLPQHRSSAKRRPALTVVLVIIVPLCSQHTLNKKMSQAVVSAFVTIPDSVHKDVRRWAGWDGMLYLELARPGKDRSKRRHWGRAGKGGRRQPCRDLEAVFQAGEIAWAKAREWERAWNVHDSLAREQRTRRNGREQKGLQR